MISVVLKIHLGNELSINAAKTKHHLPILVILFLIKSRVNHILNVSFNQQQKDLQKEIVIMNQTYF